jgi:hypothetical protein
VSVTDFGVTFTIQNGTYPNKQDEPIKTVMAIYNKNPNND